MDEDSKIPIILGRPFLATAGVMVDVRDGILSLSYDDEIVEFNVAKSVKQSCFEESCCRIDILHQTLDKEAVQSYFKDPLEALLTGEASVDIGEEIIEYAHLI